MKSLKGKRLLVLGGSASNVQLVRFAQEMGAYVIVADNKENRPGKEVADESAMISTDDYATLCDFIIDNKIDGVATGAGEWNVQNAIILCKKTGLPYYATKELWDICQDKRHFKDCCKKYGVPTVPEFSVSNRPTSRDYPVIVKPVDGCSSRGISICKNESELDIAIKEALSVSFSSEVIIEKYIDNGGVTIDAKYIVTDGKCYLEALGERYVLEGGLITAISFYPSSMIGLYMEKVNPNVQKMFEGLGYKEGVFFFQAIIDGNEIYVYEMGLRVSGGMIYNMTEAAGCNNAMKMLIYHSLTGKVCESEDISTINPQFNGKYASTMAMPLRLGKIATIQGLDIVKSMKSIVDVTVYYEVGHECITKHLNTLDQLFARVMVVSDSETELYSILSEIRNTVKVLDSEGNDLIIWKTFDKVLRHSISGGSVGRLNSCLNRWA